MLWVRRRTSKVPAIKGLEVQLVSHRHERGHSPVPQKFSCSCHCACEGQASGSRGRRTRSLASCWSRQLCCLSPPLGLCTRLPATREFS